jgi:GGDEF domain-containing protein
MPMEKDLLPKISNGAQSAPNLIIDGVVYDDPHIIAIRQSTTAAYGWAEITQHQIEKGNQDKALKALARSMESIKKLHLSAEELAEIIDQELLMEGFLNQYGFSRRAEELLAHVQRAAVISFDVRDFKKFNDTHEHQAGTQCLILFAEVIRECTRQEDEREKDLLARLDMKGQEEAMWGRVGGDEFAAILPQASEEEALVVCQRINQQLLQKFKKEFPNACWEPYLNYGIAQYNQGDQFKTIFKLADDRLYQQKSQNKQKAAKNI